MKKLVFLFSMLLTMSIAHAALAQYSHPRWEAGWQSFLNEHPRVKQNLASNPNLLYDRNYRRSHPELSSWLADHPDARRYLYSSGSAAIAPRSWQEFLRGHPTYQQYYYDNPGYFADPNWVREHSDLNDYYRLHPGVREDMLSRRDWWNQHHDYNGWRWNKAWGDAHEDEEAEQHWEHHPPGLAKGWDKHHQDRGDQADHGDHGGHGDQGNRGHGDHGH